MPPAGPSAAWRHSAPSSRCGCLQSDRGRSGFRQGSGGEAPAPRLGARSLRRDSLRSLANAGAFWANAAYGNRTLCQADHLTKYSLAQIDWKSWLGKWVARRPKDEPVIDIGYAATGGNSWSELFSPEPAKCPVDSWTGDRKHFCQIAARLNTQQHVASIIDHCAPMLAWGTPQGS